MGKTSKWLRNFLTGKKDKVQDKEKEKVGTGMDQNSTNTVENPTTQTPPKEKRRWSFRRLSASETASRELNSTESNSTKARTGHTTCKAENDQKEHTMAVVAATAAAAALIPLTCSSNRTGISIEEAAAIRIQSVFRSHLARKALSALKGLVKLQALVRGHLVRKQATATLRCMEALVSAQARVRAQRIRLSEDVEPNQRHSIHRKSTLENRFGILNQVMEGSMEENIKIVEMDYGESNGNSRSRRNCLKFLQHECSNQGIPAHYATQPSNLKQANNKFSPAQSALTDYSPRAYSGHFEDYSLSKAQSSPQHYSAMSKSNDFRVPYAYTEQMDCGYSIYPNYMANTESSRAKVRSQSAPKPRPASCERQPIRRRVSVEGRNVPRGMRMQRSSSHLGSTAKNYQYPWSLRLDRSTVSVIDTSWRSIL